MPARHLHDIRDTVEPLDRAFGLASGLALAECSVLANDGETPEWVDLLPNKKLIKGRDGRTFKGPNTKKILSAFKKNQAELPIDWEHQTDISAFFGGLAPAAAWITELKANGDHGIKAKVDWTPRGAESVRSREYRYLSPVLELDPNDSNMETGASVVGILRAGLTNNPNLKLPALNSRGEQNGAEDMDPKVLAALGLKAEASPEAALVAVETLKAEKEAAENSAATPSLDKFVPRADYDVAVNKRKEAEATLAASAKKTQDEEIDAVINAACEAGKITPATKDFYKSCCQKEGGLAEFKEFVKNASEIAGDSNLEGRSADDETAKGVAGLSDAELHVCAQLGRDPKEFAAQKAGEYKPQQSEKGAA